MPHLQFLCDFTRSLFQAFLCTLVSACIQRLSVAFEGYAPIASLFSLCLAEGRVRKSFSRTRIFIHPSMIWVPRNVICQIVFSLQNSVFWCADLLHADALSMSVLLLLFSPLPLFRFANFCLFILILPFPLQFNHGVREFKHHFGQLLILEPEWHFSFTAQFSVFCLQSIKLVDLD